MQTKANIERKTCYKLLTTVVIERKNNYEGNKVIKSVKI